MCESRGGERGYGRKGACPSSDGKMSYILVAGRGHDSSSTSLMSLVVEVEVEVDVVVVVEGAPCCFTLLARRRWC